MNCNIFNRKSLLIEFWCLKRLCKLQTYLKYHQAINFFMVSRHLHSYKEVVIDMKASSYTYSWEQSIHYDAICFLVPKLRLLQIWEHWLQLETAFCSGEHVSMAAASSVSLAESEWISCPITDTHARQPVNKRFLSTWWSTCVLVVCMNIDDARNESPAVLERKQRRYPFCMDVWVETWESGRV